MKFLILFVGFFACACASSVKVDRLKQHTSALCQSEYGDLRGRATERQLDQVTKLFGDSCFREVISMGKRIREEGHDKFYSVSSEFLEIFTPEGSVTPYVLESYERGYLSLLIALSYYNLQEFDSAGVELRRSISEEKAALYNYGDDPVITLIQAAMFDRTNEDEARPFWKKLSELKTDPEVGKFASNRLKEIDQRMIDGIRPGVSSKSNWQIYTCGKLPDYDWQMSFSRFYKISPTSPFPDSFSNAKTVGISTRAWNQKITGRYRSSYHPYLFTKGLVRLTSGIAYGAVGIASGASVGLGGCVIGASAKDDSGKFCEASLSMAGYMISKSADLVSFTLRPDLRRWRELPELVVVSRGDPEELDACPLGHAKGMDLLQL